MRGVLSSSTRIGRIVHWLTTMRSDMAVKLQLEAANEENAVDVLMSWTKDDSFANDVVANECDGVLQSTADENGMRVHARLVWYTAHDKPWITMPLRADPAQGAQQLDGTNKSMLVQAQRHTEAQAMLYVGGMKDVVDALKQTIEQQNAHAHRREERVAGLEVAIAELREENSELRAQLEELTSGAEAAAEVAEDAAQRIEEMRDTQATDQKVTELITGLAKRASK